MSAVASAPGAVRQLLTSSRPLSWINTAYPFTAAYLLAGGWVDAPLVVGTLFFLVPYNLLMYGVNDVFDHESDLRNPRKGGVEGIVLDRRWHGVTLWSAGLLTLPFAIALLAWGGLVSALVLVLVLAAVVGYSAPGLRLKERPVADSITSSTHFMGPAAFGLALTGAPVGLTASGVPGGVLPVGNGLARLRRGPGRPARSGGGDRFDRHRDRGGGDGAALDRAVRRGGAGDAAGRMAGAAGRAA